MFTLSLRSLGGSCRHVDFKAETTIADIRAELERSCPPYHTVHLFHDAQELQDGDTVQVELQVVNTSSPEKAIAELEDVVAREIAEMRRVRHHLNRDGLLFNRLKQEMLIATRALVATHEMKPAASRRLLTLLLDLARVVDDPFAFVGSGFLEEITRPLASSFGRMCGDPSAYAPELENLLLAARFCLQPVAYVAALVGVEIFARCGDAMPSKLRTALIQWASEVVTCFDGFTYPTNGADEIYQYAVACQVLGLLGDNQHADLLQGAADDGRYHPKAAQAAGSAVDLIRQRNSRQAACAAATSEEMEASVPNTGTIFTDGTDTDVQMDMALAESEREALLQEQEDLQQSILRSKADCPALAVSRCPLENEVDSAGSDNGLVLLGFTRRPKELFEALLASPLATRLTSAGVELRPEWAGGRLILAEGVTEADVSEAREPWHVAVHSGDEDDVTIVLRSIFGRERPRVKASHGRYLVPQGTSLFHQSDCSVAGATQTLVRPEFDSVWTELPIQRTFIHFPAKATPSHRMSASAPAAL